MNNREKHEAIKSELDQLLQHQGTLKPETVVEIARDPSSALHHSFEWDDAKAGHAYRLYQARQIIAVYVDKYDLGDRVIPVRTFSSLPSDRYEGGPGYRATDAILRNDEWRAELLQEALDKLEKIKEQYQMLDELAEVFRAIEHTKTKAQRKAAERKVKKVV